MKRCKGGAAQIGVRSNLRLGRIAYPASLRHQHTEASAGAAHSGSPSPSRVAANSASPGRSSPEICANNQTNAAATRARMTYDAIKRGMNSRTNSANC